MLTAGVPDPFATYLTYHAELSAVLSGIAAGADPASLNAEAHLDGLAYQRLRQDVPVETRRTFSTFFTNSTLGTRLVAPYRHIIARGATVLDPACGIGDLLIAAFSVLPRTWSAVQLERHVSTHFFGRELIDVLAAIARDRLRLTMNLAVGSLSSPPATSLPLIQPGDGLDTDVPYTTARLVLLNPPYGRRLLPRSIDWAEGLTSEAAPFTLQVLDRCQAGTKVAAILPDVLRSGSRSAKWRDQVERVASLDRIEVVGLFDTWTDVDVFIAHLIVRKSRSAHKPRASAPWYGDTTSDSSNYILANVASVSIGDVVPHRHAEQGPDVPYLSVQTTPIGATITTAPFRKFPGRLHKAPFVVVRRTSAPTRTGGSRLAPSVIHTNLGAVAVENHLIVLKPIAENLESCRRLAAQLVDPSVTSWLDKRLRTRHLTKQALLELPLPN